MKPMQSHFRCGSEQMRARSTLQFFYTFALHGFALYGLMDVMGWPR